MNKIKAIFLSYRGLPKEIYILFLARIINSIGSFVSPLLSLILTQKIGLSKTEAGVYITVLMASQAPSLLLGGKLADSFGRKKIILIFQGLGASSLILCGFLPPSITMILILCISANFYMMSFPAMDALVADVTTPENRKSSYSLLYMGHNLGFAIGPVIGGMLYKRFLPMIFIGDALTTLLSVFLVMLFIKETVHKKIPSPAEPPLETQDADLEKHETGSVLQVLFKRPVLLYFAFIMFIYQFAYSQWGFTLPLQLGDLLGEEGAGLYGLVAGFNGVMVIAFTPVLNAATHKISPMKAITFGGVLYALAFGMLGFIKAPYLFFASAFIMTLGEIMISISNGTFIANHTPASHRGRVNSVLPLIIGAGYSVGPMVTGKIMAFHSIRTTWLMVSASVFTGAVLMKILEHKETQSKTTAASVVRD